jgi:hypothetical protein
MPAAKSPELLMVRRQQVAELYLQCHSMAAIGRMMSISSQTVYKDICWAREQWRTRAADAIEAHKQRELARIDAVEVEAWRGWQRSCRPEVSETERSGTRPGDQGGHFEERSRTRKGQAGDPRFLQIIEGCIESRRKILGLDAPVKSTVELTGETLEELVTRRRQRIVTKNDGHHLGHHGDNAGVSSNPFNENPAEENCHHGDNGDKSQGGVA